MTQVQKTYIKVNQETINYQSNPKIDVMDYCSKLWNDMYKWFTQRKITYGSFSFIETGQDICYNRFSTCIPDTLKDQDVEGGTVEKLKQLIARIMLRFVKKHKLVVRKETITHVYKNGCVLHDVDNQEVDFLVGSISRNMLVMYAG